MAEPMLDSLLASTVLDIDGDRIGKVKQIYIDNDSGSPTWVAVSTGLFSSDSLVPLAGARHLGYENTLRVRVRKDRVKAAPHLVSDGRISRDAELELFAHYGMDPYRPGEVAAERRWICPDTEDPFSGGAPARTPVR